MARSAIKKKALTTEVVTSDIDHFWKAYDDIQKLKDSSTQINCFQKNYLDIGSEGLQSFIRARNLTADKWISAIIYYPRFWASIRTKTLHLDRLRSRIQTAVNKFQRQYPPLQPASIYFLIGCLQTGGTVHDGQILIGAEIAMADKTTDARELAPWLQKVFVDNDDPVFSVLHELSHLQQQHREKDPATLLGASLREGACDFVAELMTGESLHTAYAKYGRQHEAELKRKFMNEKNGAPNNYWLHGGASSTAPVMDLGYYMGYLICKSYYQHAVNHANALREILQLNVMDLKIVNHFMVQARWVE